MSRAMDYGARRNEMFSLSNLIFPLAFSPMHYTRISRTWLTSAGDDPDV